MPTKYISIPEKSKLCAAYEEKDTKVIRCRLIPTLMIRQGFKLKMGLLETLHSLLSLIAHQGPAAYLRALGLMTSIARHGADAVVQSETSYEVWMSMTINHGL
jgi:hypothetical protein